MYKTNNHQTKMYKTHNNKTFLRPHSTWYYQTKPTRSDGSGATIRLRTPTRSRSSSRSSRSSTRSNNYTPFSPSPSPSHVQPTPPPLPPSPRQPQYHRRHEPKWKPQPIPKWESTSHRIHDQLSLTTNNGTTTTTTGWNCQPINVKARSKLQPTPSINQPFSPRHHNNNPPQPHHTLPFLCQSEKMDQFKSRLGLKVRTQNISEQPRTMDPFVSPLLSTSHDIHNDTIFTTHSTQFPAGMPYYNNHFFHGYQGDLSDAKRNAGSELQPVTEVYDRKARNKQAYKYHNDRAPERWTNKIKTFFNLPRGQQRPR